MARNPRPRGGGLVELADSAPRFEGGLLYSVMGFIGIAKDGQRDAIAGVEVRTDQAIEVSLSGVGPGYRHLLHKTLAIKTRGPRFWFQVRPQQHG